ncbi:MAG: hypothetical protein ACPK7O_03595 [Methanobacterium sp.]
MEYKEFLAVLLVLSIFGVEPAGAVEIGSLNHVNSPNIFNLGYETQNMIKSDGIIISCSNKGLNKLKMRNISVNHKKTGKLILNKVKKHTYHKLSRNSLTANYNKCEQKSYSSSHKISIEDSIKSTETNVNACDDKNIKNNETNLNNVIDVNGTVFNQTGNETVVTALNSVTEENKTVFNQTIKTENNANETALNNLTEENITDFNQTANETNVNETTLNQTDNSTKNHVLNTIENAGYALAAIAGCFAVGIVVAPEGVTKTICAVGAVVCGVTAAACFVAHVFVDWFW